jgi:hypothetical protein
MYSSGIRRAKCIQGVNSAAVRVGQISTKVPFCETPPAPKNVLIVLATSNAALTAGCAVASTRSVAQVAENVTEKKCR